MIKCNYCNGKNIIKHGRRFNKCNKKVQRYECKDCHRKFMKRDITFRMRHSKYKINRAIKLRKQGLSYGQMKKHIRGISRTTLMRWCKKMKGGTNKQ